MDHMVTMYRHANWKLAVYGAEHGVPHFHVEGPSFRCSMTIATQTLIVGEAPSRVLAEARAWAALHAAELAAKWQELNG
jgi:Domain of unknown function (DUF4160)